MAKTNLARKLANAQSAIKTFAVALPQELADEYIKKAESAGVDVSTLLSNRLINCSDHDSDRAIYFSDKQRGDLEALLDSNFFDSEKVLEKLRSLLAVLRLADGDEAETIVLSPMRAYRLVDRARARNVSITKLAAALANDAIDREIGMF